MNEFSQEILEELIFTSKPNSWDILGELNLARKEN